jgi:hypothetical protein
MIIGNGGWGGRALRENGGGSVNMGNLVWKEYDKSVLLI